ncbi:VOC family protein [Nevskia ramosa]|uniref:VOC family protein n=1 Tax=Nevskia ramosa TaxID=64002 RepID=UPI0003B63264|nr:VOC family protein [Nevskia ramosa]
MAAISTLGYVCVSASNLDAWESFAVDILGLHAERRDGGRTLALRMDEYEQRILIAEGVDDDMVAAGWKFDTADALETFVLQLGKRGIRAERCDAALLASRRVERAYTCVDPDGMQHEFFYGPAYAPASRPFRSKVLLGRFVTGELGIGHYVSAAKDYAATIAFHEDALGLKVSDHIRAPLETPMGTIPFDGTFFHTETGRHHSFATAQIPFPKRIHHVMIEVSDFNDVGLAHDRCIAAGVPIMMGLGHHPNDGMFSFYCVSPSGFAIEFGSGGLVVDDNTWEVRTYSQLSDWGHKSPAH